jgi:pilus assembly protein Flp/PilA
MSPINFVLAFAMSAHASKREHEKGATAVEYALVIGLVSLVLVAAVVLFKDKLTTFVSDVSFK